LARTIRCATVGRNEKRARDPLGRQAPQKTQRERDARLGGKHGLTRRENQAQKVVTDVVVESGLDVGRATMALGFDLMPELFVRSVHHFAATKVVQRAVLGGGHEPGTGVLRHPLSRPLLQRRDEGILGELLGAPDVAHDPGDTRDEPCRLDAPNRVDSAMRFGSCHGQPIRACSAPESTLLEVDPTDQGAAG
jgi:hypothetical protein